MIFILFLTFIFAQTEAELSEVNEAMQIPEDMQDVIPLSNQPIPAMLSDIIDRFKYDPQNKRDVFKPYEVPRPVQITNTIQGPVLPLQRFTLDELRLVGIIWGGQKPMGMITTTEGKVFYVKEKDKLGNNNGYIAKIREGELVVIEEILDEDGKSNYITRIMKIQKNN